MAVFCLIVTRTVNKMCSSRDKIHLLFTFTVIIDYLDLESQCQNCSWMAFKALLNPGFAIAGPVITTLVC